MYSSLYSVAIVLLSSLVVGSSLEFQFSKLGGSPEVLVTVSGTGSAFRPKKTNEYKDML